MKIRLKKIFAGTTCVFYLFAFYANPPYEDYSFINNKNYDDRVPSIPIDKLVNDILINVNSASDATFFIKTRTPINSMMAHQQNQTDVSSWSI